MTPDDEKDCEGFLEGIIFFLNMTPQQMMEHFKAHKEDAFQQIRHFSGQGSASCTRKGMNHLNSLVRRRIRAWVNAKDLDYREVVQEITERIGPSLRQGAQSSAGTEDIFEDVFTSALKAVEEQQRESVYHFPCVLAGAKSPEEFVIGRVRFRVTSLFEAKLASLAPAEMRFDEKI